MVLFEKIGYDTSALYENISDCYLKMGEYDQQLEYLKKSVEIFEAKMLGKYSNFEELKMDREERARNTYKENEIIIIRILWKLVLNLIRNL